MMADLLTPRNIFLHWIRLSILHGTAVVPQEVELLIFLYATGEASLLQRKP